MRNWEGALIVDDIFCVQTTSENPSHTHSSLMHLQSLNQSQAQSLVLYPTCHHLFSLTEERGDKGEEFVSQIISKICEISISFSFQRFFSFAGTLKR